MWRYRTAAVAVLLVAGFAVGFVWEERAPAQPWQIELGVLPAQAMKAAYAEASAEATAFGEIPDNADAYLVTAIVINRETGQRITDAEVWATASRLPGFYEPERQLEAATINGQVTYGNYFRIAEDGPYYIDVRVEHGGGRTQRERITYQPPA